MPRGLLQAYAIKKPAFVFGIEDLMHVKDDPTMRLTATPFVHDYEDTVFLGHSVPWKGAKGIEEVRKINSKVADGLEEAIKISEACEKVYGSTRVGDRWLPNKVICQIEKKTRKTPSPA